MDNNFIMNSSSWDYANLAKSAAKYGGPEKFVEAILAAGRPADVANARLLGVTVGITVGVAVGIGVGIAVYPRALKWLSSKRKTKIEELLLHNKITIDEDLNEGTGEDLQT